MLYVSLSLARAWPTVHRGIVSARARRLRREADDVRCAARLVIDTPGDLKKPIAILIPVTFCPGLRFIAELVSRSSLEVLATP